MAGVDGLVKTATMSKTDTSASTFQNKTSVAFTPGILLIEEKDQ